MIFVYGRPLRLLAPGAKNSNYATVYNGFITILLSSGVHDVLLGRYVQTFRRNVLLPSSEEWSHRDGDNILPHNSGTCLTNLHCVTANEIIILTGTTILTSDLIRAG